MSSIVRILMVLATVALVACGGSTPARDPAAPVGQVVAVSGEVTVARAAAPPQPASVGLAVTRDMVFRTADNASLTVRFANNYEWTLAGGRERAVARLRVVDLPKVAEVTSLADELEGEGGDRTTAAGRHAEGSAADSAGTVAPPPPTAAAPPPPAAAPPPPKPARQQKPKPKPAEPRQGGKVKTYDFDDDVVEGDLVRPDGEAAAPPRAPDVPAAAKPVVDGLRPAVAACRRQHGDAPGAIVVTVSVDASGQVVAADLRGDAAGSRTGACVVAAVKTARFPAGGAPLLFDAVFAP
jgi:hypothetical protein